MQTAAGENFIFVKSDGKSKCLRVLQSSEASMRIIRQLRRYTLLTGANFTSSA